MDKEKVRQSQTQEDARNNAIEWQYWQSEQDLSMQELNDWWVIFVDLAKKFDLEEEFTENGII